MVGRTYRFVSNQFNVLFPFGYGLSYTRFHYTALDVTPTVLKPRNQLRVSFYVTNVGGWDGEEVVLPQDIFSHVFVAR